MNTDHHMSRISRRSFLQVGAATGGGLMLSLSLPTALAKAQTSVDEAFKPNAFVRIAVTVGSLLSCRTSKWVRAHIHRSRC